MRLQLGIFLALSALVLPTQAQEAIPHIVGVWRLSEACLVGPPSLVIAAPNTDQFAINGVLYPVTDILIGNTEPGPKDLNAKSLNVFGMPRLADKSFNFEMPTADTLVAWMRVKRSDGAIGIGKCRYTRQGVEVSQPEAKL